MGIEDFKTKLVNANILKIIVLFQSISCFMNIVNGRNEGLETRALVALVLLFIYYMVYDFSNIIGEGDIWFYSFQLISLTNYEFLLFWFSHLIFAIIFGIYFRLKSIKKIPLYPAYFLSELLIIWRIL